VLRKPTHSSDEDRDKKHDELAPADSLDRLADFTRRIVQVPKTELDGGTSQLGRNVRISNAAKNRKRAAAK